MSAFGFAAFLSFFICSLSLRESATGVFAFHTDAFTHGAPLPFCAGGSGFTRCFFQGALEPLPPDADDDPAAPAPPSFFHELAGACAGLLLGAAAECAPSNFLFAPAPVWDAEAADIGDCGRCAAAGGRGGRWGGRAERSAAAATRRVSRIGDRCGRRHDHRCCVPY